MTVLVRYLNPTANKALHVGHLRNAVIGSALAADLLARGFVVRRQVLIEDIGLFMARACLALMANEVPQNRKYDAFVGSAYSRYRTKDLTDAVMTRSARALGYADSVDSFALRMTDASSAEWRYAEAMRDRVIVGQTATLARLGICFEDMYFESDEIPYCENLVHAVKSSSIQSNWIASYRLRLNTGRIVELYDAPGVPSENLILLSFVRRQLAIAKDSVIVAVAGHEWSDQLAGYVDLLERIFPQLRSERYLPFFTGLVRQRGEKLSSSLGPVLLVDDEYEAVARTVRSEFWRCDEATQNWIASLFMKIPMLAIKPSEDIEADARLFRVSSEHPAWPIACAGLRVTVVCPPRDTANRKSIRAAVSTIDSLLREDGIRSTLSHLLAESRQILLAATPSPELEHQYLEHLNRLGLTLPLLPFAAVRTKLSKQP